LTDVLGLSDQPLMLHADYESDGTDGTLTIAAGKTISTANAPLDIVAFDADINGSLDAGTGKIFIDGSKPGQSVAVAGFSSRDMHISDAELGRMASGTSVQIGANATGTMIVAGVTDGSSSNVGRLILTAATTGSSVLFQQAASVFNKGITVQANGGITFSKDVVTRSLPAILNAGTGNMKVAASTMLSTSGQLLTVVADDVKLLAGASVSSGTAASMLSTFSPGQAIGIGSALHPFQLSDSELNSIVANGGLTVGGSTGGSIVVAGVTSASSDQIGTLVLQATKAGQKVTFSMSDSYFNKGIVVQAAQGITLSEGVVTAGSPSVFNAGSGTFTVQGNRELTTTDQNLVITADDIEVAALGSVNAGNGTITMHSHSADHPIGLGATGQLFHITDEELGRFTSTTGLSVGGTQNGNIIVHGMTLANTGSIGQLLISATRPGRGVKFSGSPSAFAGGAAVQAAAGIVMSQSVTTGGVTELSGGTGTITLESSMTLSTSNNQLTLISDGIDLQGSAVSSGTAATTVATFTGKTIGIGTATGQQELSGSELALITASGLSIGKAGVNLNVEVSEVTASHSNGITGVVTLIASTDGSSIVFGSAGSSTFYALSAQADNGISIMSSVTVTGGSVHLNGDTDDSSSTDSANRITFAADKTLQAKQTMTIECTAGNVQAQGALSLLAGTGMVILTDVLGLSDQPLMLHADYESDGTDGTLTIAAGKTISTANGDFEVIAFDLDMREAGIGTHLHLRATISAGEAALSVHASKTDQSLGLGITPQDMHVSDSELQRLTGNTVSFNRLGEGPIVVNEVSRKYTTNMDSIIFGTMLSGHIVSSATREARIDQIKVQSYITEADFDPGPEGVPRLEVSQLTSLGGDLVVHWYPDIYSERLSHKEDWIGLYRRGECSDAAVTPPNLMHQCFLAAQTLQGGLATGEIRFSWKEYKVAAEFEVRYFYGASPNGQGYRCQSLATTSDSYTFCALNARQVSTVMYVRGTGSIVGAAGVAGLLEKFCDPSKNICE